MPKSVQYMYLEISFWYCLSITTLGQEKNLICACIEEAKSNWLPPSELTFFVSSIIKLNTSQTSSSQVNSFTGYLQSIETGILEL